MAKTYAMESARLLVRQFDSDGNELRRVQLPDDMSPPYHSVESQAGMSVTACTGRVMMAEGYDLFARFQDTDSSAKNLCTWTSGIYLRQSDHISTNLVGTFGL